MKQPNGKTEPIKIPKRKKGQNVYRITIYGEQNFPLFQYDVPANNERKAYLEIKHQVIMHKTWGFKQIA